MEIILSSSSKTRRKILKNIGIKFNYKPPRVNEEKIKEKLILKQIKPKKICQILAKEKALSNTKKFPDYLSIGVDTCLIFKNKFISKPATKKQAKKTLKIINGKYHILYSSVFIAKNGKKVWSFNDEARLKLYKLNNKEINLYIQKLNISNMKSSGLYQIEGVGISLFEKIEGSFFTILGIPLMPLLNFFKKKKINVWK